ncbi:MAG: NUDIX domain-containing protein [Patescibacteria group bacterium]|nr:NUDIX domain-containing protein [Patescibacteria group bacterium]
MKNKTQKPEKPQIAVDTVIFNIINNDLKILLIKRGSKTFKNMWAIPGGRVNKNEPLEEAAKRELKEETGVKNVYLEQLYTFGDPKRDPRGRVISVAYFALIGEEPRLRADTDAIDTDWFSVKKLPQLAFDHRKIVNYALKRLSWKLEYTNIGRNLLPKVFTLSELREVYEIILGKKIDKRNFQKKILSLNLIKPVHQLKKNVSYRPPKLWKFITGQNVILEKRGLNF